MSGSKSLARVAEIHEPAQRAFGEPGLPAAALGLLDGLAGLVGGHLKGESPLL
jgi:hypothetical protein